MVRHGESYAHDHTATAFPAAQAAGRRDTPGRDHLVRPAAGRRGQGRQDDPDLHRGGPVVRRHLPARPRQPGQLGAGQQPRHPAVDGVAAGPLQHRVRQQPVPRPAAVLQMAGRRRRAGRPDDRAAATARHRKASPRLHRPGADPAGPCLCGPQLRAAPRYRDHRGIHRDRHPAVRAGRPAVQRHRPMAAGDHNPRQGRQRPDRPDRPPHGPEPGPVHPRPLPPRSRPGGRSCG